MPTINLGSKPSEVSKPMSTSKGPYYPTLYVSGIDGNAEIPDGEFTFTGKARRISKTETERNGKETCSFELEVMELTPTSKGSKSKAKDAGDSLDEAFTEIESAKEDMTEEGEE